MVDAPGRSARDGVRVSVASSGICGSDLHLLAFGPSPVTMGHEFCGRLDDGTPVAVLPRSGVAAVTACRRRPRAAVLHALGAMYGVSLDGGLADEVWVDPACAKVLPATMPLEHACLVEPLAVALHGINRAGVEPGPGYWSSGRDLSGCAPSPPPGRSVPTSIVVARHAPTNRGRRNDSGRAPRSGSDYDTVLEAAGTQSAIDRQSSGSVPGGTVGIVSSFGNR